ncbi:3-deoxy-manno-octulosonate cytidylyltransferase [Aurantivibrio infirmus]
MIPYSIIIPARYSSTRLPGKILADINGKPMIQHVYERCQLSQAKDIVVATDDDRIFFAVQDFGGKAVMTSASHQSGTDRLQEVTDKLGLAWDDVVVNVQGDEPLIPPAVIDQVAQNLADDENVNVATLCEKMTTLEHFIDPNMVKVVFDQNNHALYFSRAPIPWPRDNFTALESVANTQLDVVNAYRHIGIYAYRVTLLNKFVQWPMAPLETVEKLEQLRVMWNGQAIHVAEASEAVPAGVDTQEDLDRIKKLIN